MVSLCEKILSCWLLLNLVVPTLIVYRRSPGMRHKLFRWTVGGSAPLRERVFAHTLVHAAHLHR